MNIINMYFTESLLIRDHNAKKTAKKVKWTTLSKWSNKPSLGNSLPGMEQPIKIRTVHSTAMSNVSLFLASKNCISFLIL